MAELPRIPSLVTDFPIVGKDFDKFAGLSRPVRTFRLTEIKRCFSFPAQFPPPYSPAVPGEFGNSSESGS